MADTQDFKQVVNDAILDADSLEQFINGSDSETVLTRLSAEYPTLQKALKELFKNGGLPATPFKTKALMTASALVDGDYAMVTDDVDANTGLYYKESGTWVKSRYLGDNVAFINSLSDINGSLDNFNKSGRYYVSGAGVASVDNGFPFSGGGFLNIVNYGVQCAQTYYGLAGIASRNITNFGKSNEKIYGWSGVSWRMLANNDNVKNLDDPSFKILSSPSSINNGLDNFTKEGSYLLDKPIAVEAHGIPMGMAGTATRLVIVNYGRYTSQEISNQNGRAYRWGLYKSGSSGEVSQWGSWSGSLSRGEMHDLSIDPNTKEKELYVFGSSTMANSLNNLKNSLTSKGVNISVKSHALSGSRLDEAGLALGINKIRLQFSDPTLEAGVANAVTWETDWGGNIDLSSFGGVLINGVRGSLNARNNTFTPVSGTKQTSVSTSMTYEMERDGWTDDDIDINNVYIFNIGKNNFTHESAEWIKEKTDLLVSALPRGTKFIIGDHFVDRTWPERKQAILEVNKHLKDKYGERFFSIYDLIFDESVWDRLVSEGVISGKTPEDEDAINAGVLPPSMSLLIGSTLNGAHFNDAMDNIMSDMIVDKLLSLGYV